MIRIREYVLRTVNKSFFGGEEPRILSALARFCVAAPGSKDEDIMLKVAGGVKKKTQKPQSASNAAGGATVACVCSLGARVLCLVSRSP